MRAKLIRSLVLILILPLAAIIFSPSSGVLADCASGSGIKVDNGLISTYSTGSFEAGSGVSCIESSRAVIPQFALTTYDEIKTLYYDQATNICNSSNCANNSVSCTNTSCKPLKLTDNQTQQSAQDIISLPNNEKNKLYLIDGDLILNSEINPVNATGVIFVNGDLFINNKQTKNSNTTGLVFIVQGKIYIKPEVDRVDAFMISYGGFCSAYQGSDPYTCQDVADNQKQLTINGSVISLNPTVAPQFVRQKVTITEAAETINYEPKYLVILKDIFSRDLKIWQEVQ